MVGKILIVDDVATNRIVMKVKLTAAGYLPILAADGASSLASAQHHSAATRYGWQTSGNVQQGLGTSHRCVKQLAQKLRGILGVERGRSHDDRAYRIASS